MTSSGWTLDQNSPVPLHTQFEGLIKEKVQSGQWKPGEQIPSERELMRLAGISRATVRQTLSSLVNQGILQKNQGRGTFVTQTRYEQPLQIVYSFSEQLRSIGVKLKDEVLEQKVQAAPSELAQQLRIKTDDPVIHLKRLRSIQNTPMMVSIAYIPFALCPDLLHETFDTSLYVLLATKYNMPIISATDRLESIACDSNTAQLLGVPRKTPLMYIERIATTTNNVPLHIGYNYIRGDMCRFRSDMNRQPASLELKNGVLTPTF
jgi:GntR family transcriptional regulator